MDRTKVVKESDHAAARRPATLAAAFAALLAAFAALLAVSCSANVAAPTGSGQGNAGGTTGVAGANGGAAGGTTGSGGIIINVSDAGREGPNEDANCGLQNFMLDRRPAIVLLLQDRSTSMRNTLSGGATRWATTVNGVKPVLQQTQAGIFWGLKFFPDGRECGVTAGANIEPALNNADAISAQLDAIKVVANSADNLGLWDGTPVAPALRQAAIYLASLPSDKQKYILLATDGQPTCAGGDRLLGGGDPDSDDHPSGPAAVAEVVAMGIKVPVIGVAFSSTWDPTDLDDNEVTLNEMAKAGGMPRPMDPAYYAANSSAELAAAFAQITGTVISCTFDLKGMKPPSPNDVAVKINGVKLPRDTAHGQGWDYDADLANVVIYGQACDQLMGATATSQVQIIFGCPGVIIE
jgi:hypothetical protein